VSSGKLPSRREQATALAAQEALDGVVLLSLVRSAQSLTASTPGPDQAEHHHTPCPCCGESLACWKKTIESDFVECPHCHKNHLYRFATIQGPLGQRNETLVPSCRECGQPVLDNRGEAGLKWTTHLNSDEIEGTCARCRRTFATDLPLPSKNRCQACGADREIGQLSLTKPDDFSWDYAAIYCSACRRLTPSTTPALNLAKRWAQGIAPLLAALLVGGILTVVSLLTLGLGTLYYRGIVSGATLAGLVAGWVLVSGVAGWTWPDALTSRWLDCLDLWLERRWLAWLGATLLALLFTFLLLVGTLARKIAEASHPPTSNVS
jgi:hypothetical protein